MSRYGALSLFVLVACLVCAVGAAAQVEVSAVSDRQTASPGDFVTTVFEVTNQGSSTETFDLELDLPLGLTPLAPPRSVTLDADESERLFISINVTRQADAGENDVTLTAIARTDNSRRDSATIAVDVEASPSLAVRAPSPQQVLPDEAVTLTFEVVNRGNVIDRAVLEARSLRDFSLEVSPTSAELLPGESIAVGVRVSVPEGAEPGRDRITLTARSARFETDTSVTIDLNVLLPSPREVSQDLSLSVPSVFRVSETTTSEDPIDVSTSISGNAFFGDASEFSYRVAVDDPFDIRTVRARLDRPTYGVTVGDLAASLSEFIAVDGRGARVAYRAGPDNASGATVVSAREAETDGVNVGARAALQGGDWFVALAGRRRADLGETVAGASLLRLPLTSPALRVAGALSRGPSTTDSAFLVRGDATLAPFAFDGEFLRAGPDFLGARSDELSVAIEPGVEFDDAEINTVFEWERDGLETGPMQTGTAETRIGANARIEIDPLPVITTQVDYEIDSTVGTPTLTDTTEFTAEARASETFGPLTIGGNVLREVSRDRLAGDRIKRSQWRAEAELRLEAALLSARLGMTTDVDLNANAIDDRFLTALLGASWSFEAADIGFAIERNQGETRFAGEVDGGAGRWRWAADAAFVIDDDDPDRFDLNVTAGLDFELPVSFIEVSGQVEGHVFVDANGNSVRDAGEAGVADLNLGLDGVQARTDDDGFYRFPPVEPGTYDLAISFVPTTLESQRALPQRVTLNAGQRRRVDIPMTRVAGLRVAVFDDADENGTHDEDEAGLSGVRIVAIGPDDQRRSARTDSDGTAEIGGLTPGRWRVSVEKDTLPERFELTTPGQATVDLEPGKRADVAFGAVERAPEVEFSPTADFSVRPAEPHVGETVEFDGSASFDPDGSIQTYEWDLSGDGSVDATGQRVEHVYQRAGTYQITLTVTDDDGLTGSFTRTLSVSSR